MAKSMTLRERAAVKAALAMIAGNGHDAQAVVAHARQMVDAGQSEALAYKSALNAFAHVQPDMTAPMAFASRLVEKSDEATVSKYDAALTSWLRDDDASGARALQGIFAKDSLALAKRDGIAPDNLAGILGYDSVSQMENAAATASVKFAFDISRQAEQQQSPQKGQIRASAQPGRPQAQSRGDARDDPFDKHAAGQHLNRFAGRPAMQPGQRVPDPAVAYIAWDNSKPYQSLPRMAPGQIIPDPGVTYAK